MEYSPNTSWQVDGEIMETVTGFIYLFILGGGVTISLQMVTAAKKLKDACSLEEKL